MDREDLVQVVFLLHLTLIVEINKFFGGQIMVPLVSFCLICHSTYDISEKVNKLLIPQAEVIVIKAGDEEAENIEEISQARFFSCKDNNIFSLAMHNARGKWVFFLNEKENLILTNPSEFINFLAQENKKGGYISLILSQEDEEGFPYFSLRLFYNTPNLYLKDYLLHCDTLKPFLFIEKPLASYKEDTMTFVFGEEESSISPWGLFLLAEKQLNRGYYKKAIDYFSRSCLLEKNQLFKRLCTYKKIEVFYRSQQNKAALELLTQAEKFYPPGRDFSYLKGLIYKELRRYQESLYFFNQAIKQELVYPWDPGDSIVGTARGKALVALHKIESALDCLTLTLNNKPDYYPALLLLSKIYLDNFPKTVALEKIKAFTCPLEINKYYTLIHLYLDNNLLEESIASLKEGLTKYPKNSDLLFLNAKYLFIKKKLPECLEILGQIHGKTLYSIDVLFLYCLCLWSQKKFDIALGIIENIKVSTNLEDARDLCRYVHYLLLPKEKANIVHPFSPSFLKHKEMLLKLLDLSMYLEERTVLKGLITLAESWDKGDFKLTLAKFFAKNEEEELAVTFFNRAIEKSAYDGDSLLYISKIALKRNLFDESRELLGLALKTFPQDHNIYLAYARALQKEALLTLKEGLQNIPDDESLKKAIKNLQSKSTLLKESQLHI